MSDKNYLRVWRDVIFSPRIFYSQMPQSGGFFHPAGFLFIMILIGMIINVVGTVFLIGQPAIWSIPITIIFFSVIIFLGGFLISFVLYIVWRLLGSNKSYETAFRCFAYSSAISPLTSLIAFIPLIGIPMCVLWIIILLIIASETVHSLKPTVVRPFWLLVGLIVVIGTLVLEQQYRKFVFTPDNTNISLKQPSERLRQF